jgi:hypothetical protein
MFDMEILDSDNLKYEVVGYYLIAGFQFWRTLVITGAHRAWEGIVILNLSQRDPRLL